jgi:DnaJ-class molecular chaperone
MAKCDPATGEPLPTPCRRCEGTGRLEVWLQGADEDDPRNVTEVDCPDCGGTGREEE